MYFINDWHFEIKIITFDSLRKKNDNRNSTYKLYGDSAAIVMTNQIFLFI